MPIIKDIKKAKKKILEMKSRFNLSQRKKEFKSVEQIIENVREKGNKALKFYSKKFDKVDISEFKISAKRLKNASGGIKRNLLLSIKEAAKRIERFQKTNVPASWLKTFGSGEKLGYKYISLDSVGIYIPGGKIPLISTVLMTVIPAKVAGIKRIAVFTPPPVHDGILAACKILGIDEIYQIGGAQAIAAAAYGTESIKPVDKIVGPGNIYVTLAKKIVYGEIGIDGLYGPSEIAIIADRFANPSYVAMDLLSQLEHGSGLEAALLVTNSYSFAKEVEKNVLIFAKKLPNKNIVLRSWRKNSAIIVVNDIKQSIDLINLFAPEHLEIIVKNPSSLVNKIKHAGAIFIGEYSCESIGDYVAGPSHCLPTGGTARFSSGLTVMDFMKKISILSFSRKSFKAVAKSAINLASAENLKAHGDAVKIRLEDN
jgi:histidinol dehydrogenase